MGTLRSARHGIHLHRCLMAGSAVVVTSWLGVGIAAAGTGNTLYAAPDGGVDTGSCTASAPCTLPGALGRAATGDTVIVLPGTYSVSSELSAGSGVTVEGQAGQPRPRLVGPASFSGDTFSASGGAILQHLAIESDSSAGSATALDLNGGVGQDLVVVAGPNDTGGEALSVKDTAAGTALRTVLAYSAGSNGEAVSFKDGSSPGTASVENLTAIATGSGGEAVSGNVVSGTITIKDSIARGSGEDVSIKPGTQPLQIGSSNFSAAASTSYQDLGGNITAAPKFDDPADGRYEEAASSPTIGTGTTDAAAYPTDLRGTAWATPPDMGAFQYVAGSGDGQGNDVGGNDQGGNSQGGNSQGGNSQGGGSQGGGSQGGGTNGATAPHSRTLPPPSTPVAGKSVTLRPVTGKVTVELPHTHTFLDLAQAAQLPVGTVINAQHGAVSLTSAVAPRGASKTGTFNGAQFVIRQTKSAHPLTNLQLVGGSFAACTQVTKARGLVHAPLRSGPSHRVVRQLWGRDHGGKFVTIGRTASAAVRGTVWLTQDRCDGTLIRVFRGHVVVHDRAHHRNVVIGPGHSYLARVRQ